MWDVVGVRAKVSMGGFFFLFETLLPSVRAAGERERERGESYTVGSGKRQHRHDIFAHSGYSHRAIYPSYYLTTSCPDK